MGAGLPRLRGNHNIAMREGKTADKNKVYLLKLGRIAGVFSVARSGQRAKSPHAQLHAHGNVLLMGTSIDATTVIPAVRKSGLRTRKYAGVGLWGRLAIQSLFPMQRN